MLSSSSSFGEEEDKKEATVAISDSRVVRMRTWIGSAAVVVVGMLTEKEEDEEPLPKMLKAPTSLASQRKLTNKKGNSAPTCLIVVS